MDAPPPNAPPRQSSTAGGPPSRVPRALRQVVDVRAAELGGLLWSFFYFFFLLASYYVLRPLRDEMAIAGGINRLPWLFTATLGVMLLAVPLWSALVARWSPRRLIAIVYRFFLANLLLFFALFQFTHLQVTTARAFFVWISVFNLFVVSVFWSYMADVFRQEQGKRLFGFIAAGGSAGAIVGPLVTSTIVGHIGPVNLLLIAALFLEAASQCAARLGHWSTRPATDLDADGRANANPSANPSVTTGTRAVTDAGTGPHHRPAHDPRALGTPVGGGAWAAMRLLLASPYLGAIAAYVLFMNTTGTMAYLLQARLVAGEALTPAMRTALFARIDLIVNVGSAITQALLAGRVMTRFGVGPALLLSPILTIASALALGAAPRLVVLIGCNVARRVAEFAVSSPARQVLFTVVTREEKYKPKTLIDTVVFRGGDVVGSWGFTAIAGQGASLPALALSAIPLAIGWLAVAAWLARRHEQRATDGRA